VNNAAPNPSASPIVAPACRLSSNGPPPSNEGFIPPHRAGGCQLRRCPAGQGPPPRLLLTTMVHRAKPNPLAEFPRGSTAFERCQPPGSTQPSRAAQGAAIPLPSRAVNGQAAAGHTHCSTVSSASACRSRQSAILQPQPANWGSFPGRQRDGATVQVGPESQRSCSLRAPRASA